MFPLLYNSNAIILFTFSKILVVDKSNSSQRKNEFFFTDFENNPYSIIRCKVMPYIAESLSAALINTLVALTIDRYIAIVYPFAIITKR